MKLSHALAGAFASATLYAVILDRITHLYHPDYTVVTVAGGNILIWAWFVAALRGPRAPQPPALLVLINCAAGAPIVIWQIGQKLARDRASRSNHAQHARRTGDR